MININYRLAIKDDLQTVSNIHISEFPEYFLTLLGEKLVYKFYESYYKNQNILVVAEKNKKIIGFILGTDNSLARERFFKENFNKITRGGDLYRVTESLKKARDNGIKIKLNTVIIKGSNDHEISDLVKFAIANNVDIRFIELMPIGCARNLKGMKSQEIIEFLKKNSDIKVEENIIESHKINEKLRTGPAQYYNISGTDIRIGFISPLSSCFCDECNRIRVTSDGKIKQCLYYKGNVDLKKLFRTENITDEELIKILEREIYTKNRKHEFNDYKKHNEKREERIMSSIGG